MRRDASENMLKTTRTNHHQVKIKTDPATAWLTSHLKCHQKHISLSCFCNRRESLQASCHWTVWKSGSRQLMDSPLTAVQSVKLRVNDWMAGYLNGFPFRGRLSNNYRQLRQGTAIKRANLRGVALPHVKWCPSGCLPFKRLRGADPTGHDWNQLWHTF